MPKKESDEEFEDYRLSEDDDYDENEKILLNKLNRKEVESDSEEEVFGVGSEDESDADSDIALSDVEGQEEDNLPDRKAWGKDKRKFYSTDYVDPDFGGFQGKDAELAELEEEEARNLQKQLAQQLDDDDFILDVVPKKVAEEKKDTDEIIKSDITLLSKRQKLQLLEKESPEFFGLLDDFQIKMEISRDYLWPVLNYFKKGKIINCQAVEFVETYNNLILSYCTNIYMYLLLKSSKTQIKNHPVIKRLYQYRQLLSQLEPVFNEVIKEQVELLLEDLKATENDANSKQPKKKTLKILSKLEVDTTNQSKKKKKKKTVSFSFEEKPPKKPKLEQPLENDVTLWKETEYTEDKATKESDMSEDESNAEGNVEGDEVKDIEKRGITYQIAKNKGLTPYRKKEQRNPRVKHRNKFRKAKIRRKGAVREPRKELTKYSGEISGIKASVSKSIKIKT